MTRDLLTRTLARPLTLLISVALLAGAAGGVLAAPARQDPALVDEIRSQVAQVRGLDVRADVPLLALPRQDLVSRLSEELNDERTVREFLTSQMLLEVLGAMKQGFDLRQLQLNLLAEQTVALYDYDDKVIYLAADAASGGDLGANERLVLAHEMTHALQDQHFDLRRVLPANPRSSDADTAARALVEGDAMLTMRIWGRQHLRPSDKRSLGDDPAPSDPVLDSAPPLVRGELLFPYDAGWVFAQLLYQDGGYTAVDQAFLNPPRSTEQILHPEKYQAGDDEPITVAISPLEETLGGTWKTLRTDVFGELVLRLLLEPNVGWPVAEAAAAGWGGDVYTILEDASGRRVVGMVTVWDTEADAAEMYNAFVQRIDDQYPFDARRTVTQPSLGRWTIPGYQLQVIKTDNVVRIAYAPDAETLDQVEAHLSTAVIGAAAPITAPPRGAPASAPRPPAAPSPSVGPPANAPTPSAPFAPPELDDEAEPDTIEPTNTDPAEPSNRFQATPTPDVPVPTPAATPAPPAPLRPAGGEDTED